MATQLGYEVFIAEPIPQTWPSLSRTVIATCGPHNRPH